MRRNLLWGSLAMGLVAAAACTQDFDYTFEPSATGGTGGTAGTGGTGGTAGSGGGYECQSPLDCDDDGNDCTTPACNSGHCGFSDVPLGHSCLDPENSPDWYCDGEGTCVECIENDHCDDDFVCDENNCVPASCTDGVLNHDETDVDCGGSCNPCDNGDHCYVWSDCDSRFCDTSGGGGGGGAGGGGTGGGGGSTGPLGVCTACSGHADCTVAHYCDNGVCEDDLAAGTACVDDEECDISGGACSDADSICCDTECTGDCESCLGALTAAGNGNDGTCLDENSGNSCDDNVFCNGADTCDNSGSCATHAGDPCPGADGDGDCAETCDEGADNCQGSDPNNAVCDDGVYCNGADTCNNSGACNNHAGNPCSGHNTGPDCDDSCNEANNDCTANDQSGTSCDDGLFCTQTDTCDNSGTCTGAGDPCPGANGDGDCSETCDEGNDNCHANDPDGSACNDQVFCNGPDTCLSGICATHVGNPCDGPNDGDADCTETCDEGNDNCDLYDGNNTGCTGTSGQDTCCAGSCVIAGGTCP